MRSRIVHRRLPLLKPSARQLETTMGTSPHSPPAWRLHCDQAGPLLQKQVFLGQVRRSLTFLLAWLALTTHLKIAVVHKENPAGRAVTKLLTTFELQPEHQQYFIRPVGREEAEANTASTVFDLQASQAASYVPGSRVVTVTTGLVWDQKGEPFGALHTHGECRLLDQRGSPTRHGSEVGFCPGSPPTTLLPGNVGRAPSQSSDRTASPSCLVHAS